jgi:hypothetical protein
MCLNNLQRKERLSLLYVYLNQLTLLAMSILIMHTFI